MIQVSITNSATNQSYAGYFDTQDLANAWIAQEEANGSWGSPYVPAISAVTASYSGIIADTATSVTISAVTTDSDGNIILALDGVSTLSALITAWNTANPSNQLVLSGDGTQIPSEGSIQLSGAQDAAAAIPGYQITQTDITAQVAEQQAIAKGLQAQQLGAQLIAQVYYYNELNLASGALTPTLFNQLLADTTVQNIERLLQSGSLATASALFNSYTTNLATYFSSAQILALQSAVSAALTILANS